MNTNLLRIIALMFLLAAGSAQAICIVPPSHVFVGDTASDSMCTYNTIQAAIDAATTNPSCSTIVHITREHTYTDQHLTISNRNITLAGWGDGVTCGAVGSQCDFIGQCPLPTPATNPLVFLVGHDGDSVLHIDGASNVSLLNLGITGGTVSDKGGGIYYDGTGSLSLTSTTVNLNHAGYGAGINMNGDGGPASLYLNAYSQILVNTADVSGGGIRMTGTSRLYALQPHTLIGFNKALNGYGGGMEVIGPARADIGSPGFNGIGVIDGNEAAYGGGMDILAVDDDQHAIVRLFTTDPDNPVQITDNFASHTGGGIYLKPLIGIASRADAVLCASDFRINANDAQEGSAIYSDADYANFPSDLVLGAQVALNTNSALDSNDSKLANYCVQSEPPSALGAVGCASGVACNQLNDNKVVDANDQPTDGSTILLQDSSAFYADRFSARSNMGAHVLRSISAFADLTDCLIADNVLSQELAESDGSTLAVDACTIAGNQIGAPFTFHLPGGGGIYLYNSIIDQPGRGTVDPAIGFTNPFLGFGAADDLTTDATTLPPDAGISEGEPTFVDAANGDYHLAPSSLGVDYAPDVSTIPYLTTPTLDLDGNPRVVDLPTVPNLYGPRDLGAYEVQITAVLACATSTDTIFCDVFGGASEAAR